jgi:hypothetical protein
VKFKCGSAFTALLFVLVLLLALLLGLVVKSCGSFGAVMMVLLFPAVLAGLLSFKDPWWMEMATLAAFTAAFVAGGLLPSGMRMNARFVIVATPLAAIATALLAIVFAPMQACGPWP